MFLDKTLMEELIKEMNKKMILINKIKNMNNLIKYSISPCY